MRIIRSPALKLNIVSQKTLVVSSTAIFSLASLLIANITLQPIQIAKAAITPESCFAFNAGTSTITDYYNNQANNPANPACPRDVEIPATIGGTNVTSIGFGAFWESQLSSVTIPNSVTSIGDGAFSDNQLTSVTIPSSVTSIGSSAFSNNQLTSVTIPNSVTSVGSNAFSNNQLISATILNQSATLTHDIFSGNPMNSMTVGSNTYSKQTPTTEPACFAMSGSTITDYYASSPIIARVNGVLCGSDVTIPSSVTSIGSNAFSNYQLTYVTIPNSVTSVGSSAFSRNQLTSVTIPSSVTSIGSSAFSNNQLTSVTIPNSVTSVGSNAFSNNQLISATILNQSATLTHDIFSGNPMNSMTVGSNTYSKQTPTTEPACFAMSGSTITDYYASSPIIARVNGVLCGSDVTIPSSVTSIGGYAFYNNWLTSVSIPSSVTSISSGAFEYNLLTSVVIPNLITNVESETFGFNKLESITIPNSVTNLKVSAFILQNSYGVGINSPGAQPDCNLYSNNPVSAQCAYNSVWYAQVYTEDSTNPSGFTDFVMSEKEWSGSDYNANGTVRDSLGGHIINPAQVTFRYVDSQGNEIKPAFTQTGIRSSDNVPLTNYMVTDSAILAPIDPYSPTPQETADLQAGFAQYFRGGQTKSFTAPAIAGYVTPTAQSLTLVPGSNTITFTYASPTAPTLTTTSPTPTSLKLTWSANPSAASYTIQYRLAGTTTWQTVAIADPNTTSYTLNNLTANQAYDVQLLATLTDGSTVTSAVASATPGAVLAGTGETVYAVIAAVVMSLSAFVWLIYIAKNRQATSA